MSYSQTKADKMNGKIDQNGLRFTISTGLYSKIMTTFRAPLRRLLIKNQIAYHILQTDFESVLEIIKTI